MSDLTQLEAFLPKLQHFCWSDNLSDGMNSSPWWRHNLLPLKDCKLHRQSSKHRALLKGTLSCCNLWKGHSHLENISQGQSMNQSYPEQESCCRSPACRSQSQNRRLVWLAGLVSVLKISHWTPPKVSKRCKSSVAYGLHASSVCCYEWMSVSISKGSRKLLLLHADLCVQVYSSSLKLRWKIQRYPHCLLGMNYFRGSPISQSVSFLSKDTVWASHPYPVPQVSSFSLATASSLAASFVILACIQKVLLLIIWWSGWEVIVWECRCIQYRVVCVHLHRYSVGLGLSQVGWEWLGLAEVYSGDSSAGHDNLWQLFWSVTLHL